MGVQNLLAGFTAGHLIYRNRGGRKGRVEFANFSVETDGAVIKAGSTSARIATQAANQSMIRAIFEQNHAGAYGLYVRQYVATAALSGDAVRAFATVENVAAATVRGAHISLSMGTTGTITGLGVALEATLHIPSGGNPGGTIAPIKAAINSDGTLDVASTRLSFIQIVNQGDATGAGHVDDLAALFDFTGLSAGSGNLISDAGNEPTWTAKTHQIRCLLPDGSPVYLVAVIP